MGMGKQPRSKKMKSIVRRANAFWSDPDAFQTLCNDLGPGPFASVVFYATPRVDFFQLGQDAQKKFGAAIIVGCTTAGEITDQGYDQDQIVAIGFPESHFETEAVLVEHLEFVDIDRVLDKIVQNRRNLKELHPQWEFEFNHLLIDGLSTKEDEFVSKISLSLGPVPLFGGSAADGIDFKQTRILHQTQVYSNAAVLLQFRTKCPIQVFKTDHLVPSKNHMVVTGADPENRIVTELNAEPAAREYARILGKDPEQLTPFTFAAHPVVVREGGQHHVRAIQRVADNGDLIFFSAIDEGLVLTLAEPMDMSEHLKEELENLSARQAPDIIWACDCILRRLEAQEKQMITKLSNLMVEKNVIGFSTYGEQFNSMHVNQTLTGVAIYPPAEEEDA